MLATVCIRRPRVLGMDLSYVDSTISSDVYRPSSENSTAFAIRLRRRSSSTRSLALSRSSTPRNGPHSQLEGSKKSEDSKKDCASQAFTNHAPTVHQNPLVAAATRARASLTEFTRSNSVKYLIAGVRI